MWFKQFKKLSITLELVFHCPRTIQYLLSISHPSSCLVETFHEADLYFPKFPDSALPTDIKPEIWNVFREEEGMVKEWNWNTSERTKSDLLLRKIFSPELLGLSLAAGTDFRSWYTLPFIGTTSICPRSLCWKDVEGIMNLKSLLDFVVSLFTAAIHVGIP